MKQNLLLKSFILALVMLGGVNSVWADGPSKTITVNGLINQNAGTVTLADDSKTIAYTNVNNAVWYLGDFDLSTIESIDVIGAAFVSDGSGNKAELKLGWLAIGTPNETVDADYVSTNSGSIRDNSKVLAKVVAETIPTTIASGKNATNYAGANFNITSSEVTLQSGYDGTVNEGTHQAINKASGVVHLFVYGTAQSRRLAIDQIKINYKSSFGIYNKTTEIWYGKMNDAFTYLTDADTELEVYSDQALTGRCTWSKAHNLTITPMTDVTFTAGGTDYMWFLINASSGGVLSLGKNSHSITFDGENKTYSKSITKRENSNNLNLTNITFKNFDMNNTDCALCHINSATGPVTLDDITITNCVNAAYGLIRNERVVNNQLVLKGYLNLDATSYNSSAAIGTVNNTSNSSENGAININDDGFTASITPLKIKWNTNAPTAIGYGPLVTGIDGLTNVLSLFDYNAENYGFYVDGDNLKLTQAYTLDVTEAGAATLVLPFASTIPDGVEAYTLNYTSGDYVTATPVTTTLAENTPVLINAAEGSYKFISTATSGDAATGSGTQTSGALTGVYAETTVPTGSYLLTNHSGSVGFRKAVATSKVNAYRAYLTADGAGARDFLDIDFSGTTDIQEVKGLMDDGKKEYYDLLGRRVQNPKKGLYIVNGKKVLFK